MIFSFLINSTVCTEMIVNSYCLLIVEICTPLGKLQRKIEEDDDKIEDLHTVAVTTCTSVYDNCTL